MIGKLALSLSAAFVLPSSQAPVYLTHPHILQVVCSEGRGSAYQVNDNTALSVAHVTRLTGCKINGQPFEIAEQDDRLDFAVIRSQHFKRKGGIRLSCAGYKHGERYVAVGYARGLPFQRLLTGSYDFRLPPLPNSSWTTLLTPTPFIPGMSGSVVFELTSGRAVGMVNAYSPYLPLSFSLSLSETSLCKRSLPV